MENNYNPDVLNCLANLSSDEVFTPPNLVNQILDLLPQTIWKDKNAKFLDPVCKSGVFLREIAKRLMTGLENEIPDQQKRINHIFQNQLYGIAITELTSLLSRRSVYCSKTANHEKSVATVFKNKEGNIIFNRIKHTWDGSKCKYCGASKAEYDREDILETHAYELIHTDKPNKIFKEMKFDVIIGNPPYQLNDGGGTGSSAIPIYHQFIRQAKKLNPRFLTMIIPSRWFAGGRGLDDFRDEMLNDNRVRVIHDYLNASDCFPGVEIKGGVCFFLWDRDSKGLCKVYTHNGNKDVSVAERKLLEENTETFIRYNEAIAILKKVQSLNEVGFADLISANDPFGFDVRENNTYKRVRHSYKKEEFKNSIEFYYNGWKKDGLGYIKKDLVQKNIDWINQYKILIPKAWGIGHMDNDWLNPFIVGKNTCCTETYLVIGPFGTKKKCEMVVSYMQTKFFHFLVLLIKNTQNAMKKVYSFVPMQDFNETWTDEKLYKKYSLTKEEIDFIESMIHPME